MTNESGQSPVPAQAQRVDGAVIVGGSLGGLSAALGLAKFGIASTVLERTSGRTQRGVAILVSVSGITKTLSPEALDIVRDELGAAAMSQYSLPHSWWRVYTALRNACDAEPLVTIVEGAHVNDIGQDDGSAWATIDDGRTWAGDMLIGADGYRSIVRRHVDERRPDADYAGYVCWLGQSEIPDESRDIFSNGPDFYDSGKYMLAVYPLIEPDGSFDKYGWGVWDPGHQKLFREIGAIGDGKVRRTPRVDDIPDAIYTAMERVVDSNWEPELAGPVAEAFRDHDVIATPISEYNPDRVVNGRVAIIGDAAHAQTPMTGAGFAEAVTDAEALSRMIAEAETVPEGLEHYEMLRLTDMQRRVRAGQSFSQSFAGGY